MSTSGYLLSLPERTLRASAALAGGLVNEASKVLPAKFRQTRLYQATVARLLRIVIELVGDVRGIYPNEQIPVDELLKRKTAGNVVELGSILAVGWSPLWLLAAASDLIGGTKVYLKALVDELRRSNVLPQEIDVSSFGELLAVLEGTSGTLADTVDVPPLNLADLRAAWQKLQDNADDLPSPQRLAAIFGSLQDAARKEDRSLLEISSLVALGALRTGVQLGNSYIFDYYRDALISISREGLVRYLGRVSRPYLRRAVGHFSPRSRTLTEQALGKRATRLAQKPSNSSKEHV